VASVVPEVRLRCRGKAHVRGVQASSDTMRHAGCGTRSHSDSGRRSYFFTPQLFRFPFGRTRPTLPRGVGFRVLDLGSDALTLFRDTVLLCAFTSVDSGDITSPFAVYGDFR
jgi:hypothetical protein